jgi:hypothetical protein
MQKSLLLRGLLAPVLCLAALNAQTSSGQTSGTSDKPDSRSKQLEEKALDLAIDLPAALIIDGRDTKVTPLSTAQKFTVVEKSFFNPFTFLGTGFEAAVDQASNVHQGYGQGANGYGKRYGADIADNGIDQLFSIGVYPSLFHTDPRYFRVGKGNFFSRGIYASSRVFVTRTDSGGHVFNAPEILGAATSSAISRTYYPSDERNAGDFAYSMGSRIAFDAAYNLAKEFWPDVRRHLFGPHK